MLSNKLFYSWGYKWKPVISALALQISSLQSQIRSQETDLRSQEDEVSRSKMELSRLQEEEAQLEQSLLSGRVQLDSIIKSLKTTQEEITQVSADRWAKRQHEDGLLLLVWRLWSADHIWLSFKWSSAYLIKILTQNSLWICMRMLCAWRSLFLRLQSHF